jgi:hypothetical protein
MMMMVMVVPDDGDDDDDDMRREVTSVKTVIDLFSFTPPLFYRQASQVFQETYFTAARTFSWSLRRMKTASTMVAGLEGAGHSKWFSWPRRVIKQF